MSAAISAQGLLSGEKLPPLCECMGREEEPVPTNSLRPIPRGNGTAVCAGTCRLCPILRNTDLLIAPLRRNRAQARWCSVVSQMCGRLPPLTGQQKVLNLFFVLVYPKVSVELVDKVTRLRYFGEFGAFWGGTCLAKPSASAVKSLKETNAKNSAVLNWEMHCYPVSQPEHGVLGLGLPSEMPHAN